MSAEHRAAAKAVSKALAHREPADSFPWPALDGSWPMGRRKDGPSPQWPWEPPRTCGKLTGRAHQLRALGNGWVVPQALLAWRLLTS